MRIGDIVRFREPLDDFEKEERFVVIELRGLRVLVEAQIPMFIKPQCSYLVSDLILANSTPSTST